MWNDVLRSVVIDVLGSDVIDVVRCGVAGGGVFCWGSEMLFLRVCSLQYCSYSSVVQWWKLDGCDPGGPIQNNL